MNGTKEYKDPMEEIKQFLVKDSDFQEDKSVRYSGTHGKYTEIKFCIRKKDELKCVKKTVQLNSESIGFFVREVGILGTQKHSALVPFIGFSCRRKKSGRLDKGFIYLAVMERGSLCNNIKEIAEGKKIPNWDDTHKLIIAYGIACAMEFLHYNNVIHRDLKPDNVLLDSELRPYVTDFDTSKFLDELKKSNGSISSSTPYIMSPEFFENPDEWKNKFCIDYYAYGITIFYLITGRLPSVDINEVISGNRLPFPENTPEEWKTLIEKCWSQKTTERPNFTLICDFLESNTFADPNKIDLEIFNNYKNNVHPLRPNAEMIYHFSKHIENGTNGNEVNGKQTIELIKRSAASGDTEAQYDYGMHLLNGIHTKKNIPEAARQFHLAADKGHATSMLWYSILLQQKERHIKEDGFIDDSSDYNFEGEPSQAKYYLDKCEQTKSEPEVYSIKSKFMIESGKHKECFKYLVYSVSKGSIYSTILLGNLCESKKTKGSSDFYYQQASNRCHCLDSCGFTTPIEFNIYRCLDCNENVCEGCAKHCHRGHTIKEMTEDFGFVCDCGKKGFPNKCTCEFIGENKIYSQHLYQCEDCNKGHKDIFICKSCAEKCHSGHKIIDCGIQKNVCSCGLNKLPDEIECKCFNNPHTIECTAKKQQTPNKQRWFQCITCGDYGYSSVGICEECIKRCHSGHFIIDLGLGTFRCKCFDNNNCQFKHK